MEDLAFEQPWDNLTTVASTTASPYSDYTPHLINASNTSFYGTGGAYQYNNHNFVSNHQNTMLDSWYAMLFIILLMGAICTGLMCREFCARWCPGDCGSSSLSQHVQNASRHAHRRIAPDLMDEQEQQLELEVQRKERRLWYQYYLKPYIVVCVMIGSSDIALLFVHAPGRLTRLVVM
jgi:hypothetical protein